ncbi:hypothetical protein QJQ45_028736, partial [Haematococcus lacustris]
MDGSPLSEVKAVLLEARARAESLGLHLNTHVSQAPTSWEAAEAAVLQREETKQRENPPKSKKGAAPDVSQSEPGLRIGSTSDASAFWLLVDDYFRDVTCEDILFLLPQHLDVSHDDALLVPSLGRGRPEKGKPGRKPAGAREGQPLAPDTLEVSFSSPVLLQLRFHCMPPINRATFAISMQRRNSQSSAPDTLQATALTDMLASGISPSGQRTATMLQACTDAEAQSLLSLLTKLGLTSTQPAGAAATATGSSAPPAAGAVTTAGPPHQAVLVEGAGQAGLGSRAVLPAPLVQVPAGGVRDRASLNALLAQVAAAAPQALAPLGPLPQPALQQQLPPAQAQPREPEAQEQAHQQQRQQQQQAQQAQQTSTAEGVKADPQQPPSPPTAQGGEPGGGACSATPNAGDLPSAPHLEPTGAPPAPALDTVPPLGGSDAGLAAALGSPEPTLDT